MHGREELRAAREAALREVGGRIVPSSPQEHPSLGVEREEPVPSVLVRIWERRWSLRAMLKVASVELDAWWFRLRSKSGG